MKKLNAGDVIYCPSCKAQIAELKVNIKIGQPINANMFKGIQKPIKNGDLFRCDCGANYFDHIKGFYTKKDL